MKPLLVFLFLIAAAFLYGCKQPAGTISFYYWRTSFILNATEQQALQREAVTTLYVRYFDVAVKPGYEKPVPVSPIRLDSSIHAYKVVPVIYIKNQSFERTDSGGIPPLAQQVYALVNQINQSQHLSTTQIQFDCDWTVTTRNRYFFFLQQYRALSGQPVSATIRLHQVKYAGKTGIPPVDYGVLMYYNMGSISSGTQNSIYDAAVAGRYITALPAYPLLLDVALPVFSWGYTVRNGNVVQLLNKINFSHFQKDSNFIQLTPNRFQAKHACFRGGYYFRENDLVKLESVPAESLPAMADMITRYSNGRLRNLIFYDLDSINLTSYDENIFKKTLDHFN